MHFLGRRAAFYLLTAWAAITINFLIPRLMPGNPVEAVLARYQGQLTYRATRALEIAFGLNLHENLWSQYVQYWGNLAHGNFGLSFTYFPTPVSTIIAQSLPWTLVLVGLSTIIAWASVSRSASSPGGTVAVHGTSSSLWARSSGASPRSGSV